MDAVDIYYFISERAIVIANKAIIFYTFLNAMNLGLRLSGNHNKELKFYCKDCS